ncbi:MAG: hypothetical protein NDJ92_00060 [Thermoanaerobaculia bacterium]|nr:hypothetical protein [Thermoanaerobaculia bacterium]
MHDSVVNPLAKAVRGATRPEPAPEEAPQALFDSDVSLTALADVEV